MTKSRFSSINTTATVAASPPSVSPDGSVIYSGKAGSLTTAEGTWTFSTALSGDGVDYLILLNGSSSNGGAAVQMQITNGKLYALAKISGHWYLRQNSTWVDAGTTAPVEGPPPPPPPSPPPSVSPDGSVIYSGKAGSLTTAEGTWTFSTALSGDGVDYLILLNGSSSNGGAAVQMQITNGKLYALAKISGHWYLRQNSTWVDAGTTAPVEGPPPPPPPSPPPSVSPDGSVIYSGKAGSLTTAEGTWTFSTALSGDGVDYLILLNGSSSNGGAAVQMQITNGKLYALAKISGHWYLRQNSTWVDAGTTAPVEGPPPPPPPPPPPSVSPDGSVIYSGKAGSLTTAEGTWTFSTALSGDGVDYLILLNGSSSNGGAAVQMQITNGKLYALAKISGHWYLRQNSTWVDAGTTAPVEGPPPPPPPSPPPSVSPDGSVIYSGKAGSLTTAEGTWTFSTALSGDGVDYLILLNGSSSNGGAAVQMQITNGKLYALAKISGHWYLRQNSTWVDAGTTAPVEGPPPPPPPSPPPSVSPDGSVIYSGKAGSLTTAEGTWTFSTALSGDGVDYLILLNGSSSNGGAAVQMQITNGKLYALAKISGHWYLRQNSTWVDAGTTAPVEGPPPPPPPPPPPSVSPDGSVIYSGKAGGLTTAEGTWTFSTALSGDGVDYLILLNGSSSNGGAAVQMQITNGKLYALAKISGHWYLRQNSTWVDAGTTAPVEGASPTPTAITLSPANATIPDNAPAGTVIATAHVTMSDGSQFTGTLATSDTNFFAISGLNIVTARAFTSADDGTHLTVITASQGGQSFSIKFSV